MTFKKKKIKKSNTILNIFGAIIISLLIVLGIYASEKVVEFRTKETIVTESGEVITKDREVKKEASVLIVGRGGNRNDAPELTDTIILAKINSEKKTVSLLSIQRDLYVNYPDQDGHGKINSVYAHYYYKNGRDEKAAMEKLKEKISDITGEKIDYYINIDFDGFEKLIDTLGGIEIDVKENLVDRQYPTSSWGYQTVSFKKGLQTMNGDRALKYSRSRHSTSDFDRSLRQQQVIQAVKDKVMSSYLISPTKINEIYQIFINYLSTDITATDAINLVLDLGVLKENYIFISSNFNDTCYSPRAQCEKGGILYVPKRDLFGGMWVSLVNGSTHSTLSEYGLSRKYSNIVLNDSLIEKENAEINIFNGTKISGVYSFVNKMKRYGFKFTDKNFVSNTPGREFFKKSVIYYNGVSPNSDTIQALKKFFKGDFIRLAEPKFSTEKAKIEIIVGEDYFKEKNIFNF